MKFHLTREMQVPKGALKITDKQSDAVAYLYASGKNGKPAAAIFLGKSDKAASRYYYGTEHIRELAVIRAFEGRRKEQAVKLARRTERKSWTPDYKVGEVLNTCWGYDQTNVEYFEVVEVRGKHVILREIAQERNETHHMQGNCAPLPGKYLSPRHEGDSRGQPIRRLAQQRGVKIDDVRWASRTTAKNVAGVKVYESSGWSSYA